MTVSQLSAATGIARASIGRLLLSLHQDEAIAMDETGRYRASSHILEPALGLLSQGTIRDVAFPYMVELSSAVGYQVTLGLFEYPDVIFVETVMAVSGRVSSRMWYSPRPLLDSHTGQLLVAFSPASVRDSLLCQLSLDGKRMATDDEEQLRRDLERIREQGYIAFDRVAATDAPTLLAVPITDRTERPVAALTVTRTTALDAAFVHDVLPKALDVTARISTELGSRRGGPLVAI